jgi:hypothetical protein
MSPFSGPKYKPSNKPAWKQVASFHAGFLPDLFFDHEDGGDMFFRNVSWLSTDCTALYPRRQWEPQILHLHFMTKNVEDSRMRFVYSYLHFWFFEMSLRLLSARGQLLRSVKCKAGDMILYIPKINGLYLSPEYHGLSLDKPTASVTSRGLYGPSAEITAV